MNTKASLREKDFAPGTSRKREATVTLLQMARDRTRLLEMGQRIKELRERTDLKQQYIADYCGVELRTYQFWQQGKHPPSGDALKKLAELFGVSPDYILRGETPDPLAMTGDERLRRIEEKQDAIILRLDQLLRRRGDPGAGGLVPPGPQGPLPQTPSEHDSTERTPRRRRNSE